MIKAFESEKIIEFNPSVDGEYLFAVDSLLSGSLYVDILKSRTFWKQAPGPAGFNMLISQHTRSCDYYKQQSTPRCIFNHLPTSEIMMNRLEFYRLVRFTHKNAAFRAIRLQYDLSSERVKVINHIEYLSHLCMKKDPADFHYNIAPELLDVRGTIKRQRKQTQQIAEQSPIGSLPPMRCKSIGGQKGSLKPHLLRNYVYEPERPGNQKALEQEAENDYIWGRLNAKKYYETVGRSHSTASPGGSIRESDMDTTLSSPRLSFDSHSPESPINILTPSNAAPKLPSKLQQSSTDESTPLAVLDPLTLRLPSKSKLQVSQQEFGLSRGAGYKNAQRFFVRRPPKPLTVPIQAQTPNAPIPNEFNCIDWKLNMSNQWAIVDVASGGIKDIVVHPAQLPSPEDSKGLIAVKIMEHNLRFYGRKILLKMYCLVRQNGDAYIYRRPVIELEKLQKKKNQYVSPERDMNYTRKRDQDYLVPTQIQTLIRQSGFPEIAYEKIILKQARESIVMILESFKQKLCQAPSQNCFELFEFTFEVATGVEKFRTEIVHIESTPSLPVDNSVTFCIYPQMLDDMYSIVLDPFFPPKTNEKVQKQAKQMPEARPGETDFDVVARTKVSDRVFFGMRWHGGRDQNLFDKHLNKWSRTQEPAKEEVVFIQGLTQ